MYGAFKNKRFDFEDTDLNDFQRLIKHKFLFGFYPINILL